MVVTDDSSGCNMVITDDSGGCNMVITYDYGGCDMVVSYDNWVRVVTFVIRVITMLSVSVAQVTRVF